MRDTEVVASVVARDPHGLATAYDQYADSLFKYCRTLLSDPADAADAVQDTFVIAASRPDGLRDPGRLRAWLYAVARNEALRILRSEKGTPALDEAPEVTDDSVDVSEQAERAELKTLFEAAAAGLNPGDREIIELQLRQGLEAAEIASVLGVPRNHAHSLLSRAREQLEACLAALLVSRTGRGDCGELDSALAGWDGRLTPLLRKRVHRHIERCATCAERRAFELRPAMLLDRSPGAALAAGAAASFRMSAGAPAALKQHTLALAAGHGPAAAAHSAAVIARAGDFGKAGFPRPVHAGKAGLAGQHGAGGVRPLRSSPSRQVTVAAAVVITVAIAIAAFALTGHGERFKPSADPRPPATAAPPQPSAAPPPASAKPRTSAAAKGNGSVSATACPAVKFSPGGAAFSLYTGFALPYLLVTAGPPAASVSAAVTAVVLPVSGSVSSAASGREAPGV